MKQSKRPVLRFPAYWRAYYWMMFDQKIEARNSLLKELECIQMQIKILDDLIAGDEVLEVILR